MIEDKNYLQLGTRFQLNDIPEIIAYLRVPDKYQKAIVEKNERKTPVPQKHKLEFLNNLKMIENTTTHQELADIEATGKDDNSKHLLEPSWKPNKNGNFN